MAAMEHEAGLVLGQESIGEKSNEIPYMYPLLNQLGNLSGAILTADALHTQRAHAQALHKRGAHYVLTVKGNQKGLKKRALLTHPWVNFGRGGRVCGRRG